MIRTLARCFVSLLVVGLGTILALAVNASAEPTQLSFAVVGHSVPVVERALERFHELNPDIKVEIRDRGNEEQFILESLAGTAPDVVELYPQITGGIIASGLVLPWEPFIDNDSEISLDDFVPGARIAYSYQGQTYGMLSALSIIPVFTNNTMIAEAGLEHPSTLGDEWTWDRLHEYARHLTRVSPAGETVQWGMGIFPLLQRFVIWMHQAGGGIVDDPANPTKSTWTDPAVREALAFIHSLHDAGYAEHKLVASGEVAIEVGSTTERFMELLDDPPAFEWGLVQWPRGKAHNGIVVSGEGYLISSQTEYPQESWRLVKFMLTDPEVVRHRVQHYVRPPSYLPSALEFHPENLPQGLPVSVYETIRDMVFHPELGSVPTFPQFGEIQNHFGSLWPEVIANQMPLDHLIEEMHRFTNQRLNE